MTPRALDIARKVEWGIVLSIAALTPLVISPNGYEPFRLPKLLFFQTMTLTVAALVTLVGVSYDDILRRVFRHRFAISVAAGAVAWTGIVTLLSKKPVVSHSAPFTMFCYALFFVLVLMLERPTAAAVSLAAIILPGVITAAYGIAQFLKYRTPFIEYDPGGTRFQVIALLGNPNLVGAFLVLPIVATLAAIFTWPRSAVWLSVPLAAMAVAVIVSLTLTAVVAIATGVLTFVFTVNSTRARYSILLLFILAASGILSFEPARDRAVELAGRLKRAEYDTLATHRLSGFTVAALMFQERPLIGVGPGVFSSDYMTYRLRVDELHPEWMNDFNPNFAEVHNDHLQVLAETGLIGYSVFLTLLFRIGKVSFRRVGLHSAERFASILAFPMVASFSVLALAQFPTQIAACAVPLLLAGGLCLAWEPTSR